MSGTINRTASHAPLLQRRLLAAAGRLRLTVTNGVPGKIAFVLLLCLVCPAVANATSLLQLDELVTACSDSGDGNGYGELPAQRTCDDLVIREFGIWDYSRPAWQSPAYTLEGMVLQLPYAADDVPTFDLKRWLLNGCQRGYGGSCSAYSARFNGGRRVAHTQPHGSPL